MRVTGKKTEYTIDAYGNILNKYEIPTGLYIDENHVVIDYHGFPSGYYHNSQGKFMNRFNLATGLMSNLEGQIYRELASATPEQSNYYKSHDMSTNFFSGGMTEPNPGRTGSSVDFNVPMRR
jgi:hypothetical protein